MPFSFNDTIDADTDLMSVDLWNVLLRAVHERLIVAQRTAGTNLLGATPPTLTPGYPNILVPGTDTSDPLRGVNELTTDATTWGHCRSIVEMQIAIDSIYTTFWNNTRYPNGYAGMATPADDRYIALEDLAAALGYPSDVPSGWQSIIRTGI